MEDNPRYNNDTSSAKNPDNPVRISSEANNHQVPKKRREMVLSLGKTTFTNSDQTPTPTRFIRNCEEVGLFQDLKCDNPFEGAFRKAAEEVRTGAVVPHAALNFSLHGADDTLHTPHVFPGLAETVLQVSEKISTVAGSLENNKVQSSNRERVVKSEADTSHKTASPYSQAQNEVIVELSNGGFSLDKNYVRGRSLVDSHNNNNNNSKAVTTELSQQSLKDQNVKVLLKMPDGMLLLISTTPVDQANAVDGNADAIPLVNNSTPGNKTVILNTQACSPSKQPLVPPVKDTTSIVKQKLKQALLSGFKPKKPSSKVPISSNHHVSLVTPGHAPAPAGGGQGTKVKREETAIIRRASSSTNSEEDANDEKRRKALERNRVAAMRCREKRKAWVADLRRRAEAMTSTNQNLLQEVASLRAEVARLKALLLMHKNCPVTLAAIANGAKLSTQQMTKFETVFVQEDHTVAQNLTGGRIGVNGEGRVLMLISKSSIQDVDKKQRTSSAPKEDTTGGGGGVKTCRSRVMRERLSLDIEGAARRAEHSQDDDDDGVIDLDSPLVRSDKVLSSVALTTTPTNDPDKLVTFPVDDDDDDHMDVDNSNGSSIGVLDDGKALATPVIQLNPNAVFRTASRPPPPAIITCPTTTDYS